MKFAARLWLFAVLSAGSFAVHAGCETADMDVRITKSVWHNRCSKQNCAELKGSAVLTSTCKEVAGVQVRLSGLDASGSPIAQRDSWPYALSEVQEGEYSFSLDKWLKHDPEIRGFRIEVIQVRPLAR